MFKKMKLLNGGVCRRLPVARLALCVTMVLVMAGVFTLPVPAAGLYTHTWFVERAIQRLAAQGGYAELVNILNKYPHTVNYGSIFPDVTYGIDSPWAEVVHDTYGVNTVNSVQYLEFLDDKGYDKYDSNKQTAYYKEFLKNPPPFDRGTIPAFRHALIGQMLGNFRNNPRSENDERMIAFLFGLIAHQEADSPWHWNYNVCDTPNFLGIGWGLECEAMRNKGYTTDLRELQLDWILYHYDSPEHTVDFPFMLTVKFVVLAASDATGSPRPVCSDWNCFLWNWDAIEKGEDQIELLWGQATSDWGPNDGMKGFLETYVPGGIEYGSALTAAAWMQAWIEANEETVFLPLIVR